jgi:hypothetical protein
MTMNMNSLVRRDVVISGCPRLMFPLCLLMMLVLFKKHKGGISYTVPVLVHILHSSTHTVAA